MQEGIKLIKRATSDKYPEVRLGAAVFAGLIAPMLIRNIPNGGLSRNGGGKDNDDSATPLAWLEEVTQFAMKNIDDESAGVATAWASALARCICVAVEHGKLYPPLFSLNHHRDLLTFLIRIHLFSQEQAFVMPNLKVRHRDEVLTSTMKRRNRRTIPI